MGSKTRITALLAVMLLVGLGATNLSAQVIYGQPTSGGVRFIYDSWKVEADGHDTTISQAITPVTGFVPVAGNFDVSFYVAGSGNKLTTPSDEFSLNGLTDFRVQARHSFANDQVLVALGLTLPTGKTKISFDDEWQVLQAMSRNYVDLPLRRLGEGFGFNLMVGGATTAGENLKLGAGISYNYVGKYKPYADYVDYNPGDVIAFNGSAELDQGDYKYYATLIYSHYMADKVEGYSVFGQSPSLDARFAMNRKGDVISYGGMLRYVSRGKNKLYPGTSLISLASTKLYGNEFSVGAHVGWTMAENWTIVPSVDLRYIGANDIDFNHSTVLGFGGIASRAIGKNFNVEGGFKLYTGSATVHQIGDKSATTNEDVSGYQINLGLTASM